MRIKILGMRWRQRMPLRVLHIGRALADGPSMFVMVNIQMTLLNCVTHEGLNRRLQTFSFLLLFLFLLLEILFLYA